MQCGEFPENREPRIGARFLDFPWAPELLRHDKALFARLCPLLDFQVVREERQTFVCIGSRSESAGEHSLSKCAKNLLLSRRISESRIPIPTIENEESTAVKSFCDAPKEALQRFPGLDVRHDMEERER